MAITLGGNRIGSGRPVGAQNVSTPAAAAARVDFETERAAHEAVKRKQREFKLAVDQGMYSRRADVRQASATALAVLTQSLRSIPDNIERTLGVDPVVVDAIAQQIDAGLAEVAAAFKAMTTPPGEQT